MKARLRTILPLAGLLCSASARAEMPASVSATSATLSFGVGTGGDAALESGSSRVPEVEVGRPRLVARLALIAGLGIGNPDDFPQRANASAQIGIRGERWQTAA